MNKSDVTKFKKYIDTDNNFFTVNNILTAVINKDVVYCTEKRSWISYSQSEQEEIISIMKKVLTGKIGKVLTEYEFPISPDKKNASQELLMNIMISQFEDEDLNEIFINKIKDGVKAEGAYTVLSVNFTISVYDKNADHSDDVSFVVTAFCPIKLRIDGFIYNDESNTVEKKTSTDRILEQASDGFMFPTFTDRQEDVNHVMYFSKNAGKPNTGIIENVLGCKYIMSSEQQKVHFWGMVANVLGEELNYDMIVNINEKLSDLVQASEGLKEAREIDCADIQHILEKCDVPKDKLDDFGKIYDKVMSSRHSSFIAANLCDEKVNIKFGNSSLKIDYKKAATALDVQIVNGKKCLVFPLDSAEISVLGIDTSVNQSLRN